MPGPGVDAIVRTRWVLSQEASGCGPAYAAELKRALFGFLRLQKRDIT